MALLTDGNPNDTEALRRYETAILDVAKTESIDLDTKLGLATEEISADVLDVLLDHARIDFRRRTGVGDVVVTAQMQRWLALHTLAIVYRDAFNNQLNDRYKAKWNEYLELSKNAREDTLRFGIGLALNPIPRGPQPVFSFAVGVVTSTLYYAQLSWVSATGQEGAPGDLTTYQTPEGSALIVSAPTGPAVAAGFNVYLGLSADAVTLQGFAGIGGTFTLNTLVTGNPPGTGQAADTFVIGGRMLRRG